MQRHYHSTLKVGRDVVGGFFSLVAGIYLLMSSSDKWFAWALTILGVVLLLMVAYLLFVLPGMIYRSQPKLKEEYSLTFADDCIEFKTNSVESTLQWSMYQSWLSDDDFYIMYYGSRNLTVIPRRVLSNEDDRRLRQMLTEKIGRYNG